MERARKFYSRPPNPARNAEDREPGTGNREPGSGNRKLATASTKPPDRKRTPRKRPTAKPLPAPEPAPDPAPAPVPAAPPAAAPAPAPAPGLVCPECGCTHFLAEDGRPWEITKTERRFGMIRRRRQCRHCGRILWTREVPEPADAEIPAPPAHLSDYIK